MSNGCLYFDLNMNTVDYGTRKKCFPDYDFHQGYSSTHLSNLYDSSNFCLFCASVLVSLNFFMCFLKWEKNEECFLS